MGGGLKQGPVWSGHIALSVEMHESLGGKDVKVLCLRLPMFTPPLNIKLMVV